MTEDSRKQRDYKSMAELEEALEGAEPVALPSRMKEELDMALDAVEEETFGEPLPKKVVPVNAQREATKRRLGLLRKIYGQKLTALIVGCWEPRAIKAWIEGTEDPLDWQANLITQAYDITTILLMRMQKETVKAWMITPTDYLAGWTPAEALTKDALTVRQAAMDYVARSPHF